MEKTTATKLCELEVNGVAYVPKDSHESMPAKKLNNMQYAIVRTYSAGVFAGYVESRSGREVVLRQARRLWYWKGAASLSQLAVDGTSNPDGCKFPCEVDSVLLLEVIEILPVTRKAQESIQAVRIWKA